jgi:threonine synthase
MWRYRELLPVRNPENVITLAEGFTPLIRSRSLGPALGLSSLFFKDESRNPTGSFKARGLSTAISRAKELGIREVSLPTAGNAGGAAAAFAAAAGLRCHVFMPKETPRAFVIECRSYGASLTLVDGVITDAASRMRQEVEQQGWFDVSTLKEPYRVEGKKTILYEIAQQFEWSLPDVIVFPTGGGTGIVGAWKAALELKELGWLVRFKMPRLIVVQAAGCAPIVRAFEQKQERASEWENPQTFAGGLRVPRTVGDFLILRALRESHGTAIALPDDAIRKAWKQLAEKEGLFTAPEAAAAYSGLQELVARGLVDGHEKVVLLLTGSGLKYVDDSDFTGG